MQYTTLGKRTGLKVSVLGFGAMRLPMEGGKIVRAKAIPMVHTAFENGVNYIDTAVGYCNADSQVLVGEALKGWRDKVTVSTKNHSYRKGQYDAFQKNLEDSLRRLDIEQIDIYNFHGLNFEKFREHLDGPDGAYKWIEKAKDQGLIKHICFSFHGSVESLLNTAKTGLFDVVTCQYNLLDQANGEVFAKIKALGMGIVVMGPVGGGRLGAPSAALQKLIPGARSVPEVAMRFVLANPHVDVALSGMSTIDHVTENLRVCSRKTPLTSAEKRRVTMVMNRYKKLADLYCTGCKYCMPCPAGVNIPACFDSLNNHRVYNLEELALRNYSRSDNRATLCRACGKCMDKCPQNIDIISQLRETVRTLDDAYGKLAVRLSPGKLTARRKVKGVTNVQLTGKLELINYSDNEVAPAVAFAPAKGVTVKAAKADKPLATFERRTTTVKIAGPLRPGEALETGLAVDGGPERIASPSALQVALAAPGGKAALGKAAREPVANDDAKCRATKAVAAKHKAKFAVAYDAKALYLRVNVTDDCRSLTGKGRSFGEADRVQIALDMTGVARPRGDIAPGLTWTIEAALPAETTKAGQLRIPMMGKGGRASQMACAARKTAGGATLDIEIPWRAIDCPPGRAGRSFRFNLAHLSHSGRGKRNCHRLWAPDGGWVVLA